MAAKIKLPMGIENFEEMRTMGYYYIDKTKLISDLLENLGKVTLFTRPRRFGKTLNISMLKYFFEIGTNPTLFDGLAVSQEKELCAQYMGKFPVLTIRLKNASGFHFNTAKRKLRSIIGTEALRFQFLTQSAALTETERQQYQKIISLNENGEYAMSDGLLEDSLLILSQLLQKHYGQKTILLIDEYDVPLDKAYQSGYYNDMVEFMKTLFGQVLKTNDSLYFAVLTGCLRISKESIFTGLNNFDIYTIKDAPYNAFFGFTDCEVRTMLDYYGFEERYSIIKEWYDGYQFADLEIYCPWDVISYCHTLKMNPSENPQNYWVNTSSNDIIRKFIEHADSAAKKDIELLIAGKSITKEIHQELTYRDLESDIDHLWSVLYTTGYLTQRGTPHSNIIDLAIPNKEIHWIFVQQIRKWFKDEARKDLPKLHKFCKAFQENDTTIIEEEFQSYLKKTISIRDTNSRKEMKENFYHGILLGLFGMMDGWTVKSNAESGDGYSDISIEIEDAEIGIIIELKYAENANFETACQEALQQIQQKNYKERLIEHGMKTIYCYGIACFKKRCKVVSP